MLDQPLRGAAEFDGYMRTALLLLNGLFPVVRTAVHRCKKNWEQNRRTCQGVFNNNQSAMENCIHSLDLTVDKPCTCASNCSRATCTEWNLYNHACVSAEWR